MKKRPKFRLRGRAQGTVVVRNGRRISVFADIAGCSAVAQAALLPAPLGLLHQDGGASGTLPERNVRR
jgi:hypothetical protein